jgi:predicted ATPase
LDTDRSHTDFTQEVRDALGHLYDTTYLQTHSLTRFLLPTAGRRAANLGADLQQILLKTIESMRPSSEAQGRDARSHQILELRYVEALDVDEAHARLGISRTEYHRTHRRALDAVVSLLAIQWQVNTPGERPALTPPAPHSQPAAPATNLPIGLSRFFGRERELTELRLWLRDPRGPRLITLTGAGGAGKSRLAIEVATRSAPTFPDGAYLIELAALTDPGLVAATVAAELALKERASEPILDTLIRHLGERQILLILDNCEHLIEDSAKVAEVVLQRCAGVRIIATSREALRVGGEVTVRVPPLTVPPTHGTHRLDQLDQYEAVRLFLDRASAANPEFALGPHNAGAIAAICGHLEGIPLAIELAAARVRTLSVEQIVARLDVSLQLLTLGSRTARPRHQTMSAAIQWSYDLLTAIERLFFERLSVFAGGWSLDAAESVCSGEGIDSGEVLDILASLVEKSLVTVENRKGEARYRLLETIREFAQQRLDERED